MKTLLMLIHPGCKLPKQNGTATSTGSALKIRDMRNYAVNDNAKFFIVDADSAEHARALIRDYRDSKLPPESIHTYDNEHTICIGTTANEAIAGSNSSISAWDTRLAKQGKVTMQQSKALK